MHPYDHALSSVREHGGAPEDFLAVHRWFDATKVTLAHFTHRALRHHAEGAAEATELFGETVTMASGQGVRTDALAFQHLREDMPEVPPAARWLACLPAEMDLPSVVPLDAEDLAVQSARKYGGEAMDYLPLHRWFLGTEGWFDDSRHLAMRHHSFGVFAAEERFGVVLRRENGTLFPTRIVAERHVRTVIQRIPTPADYLRRMKGERWMNAAQHPGKLGLR